MSNVNNQPAVAAEGSGEVSEGTPAVNVRVWTSPPEGTARNIFAIETPNGFVVVDGPFRKSDGVAGARWLEGLGRPILAALVTHAHPDHYFGLTEMLAERDVPIYATAAVAEGIRSTEEMMARTVAGFIGDEETERDRRLPNALAESGRPVVIDGVQFLANDFGETESAADSVWTTPALPGHVFSGDLVMHRVHVSLYQGRSSRYIAAIERLGREAQPTTLFLTGHGGLATVAALRPQIVYIESFRKAVRELAQGRDYLAEAEHAKLVGRMREVEPSPLLAFLIGGGGNAVARELAAEELPNVQHNDE